MYDYLKKAWSILEAKDEDDEKKKSKWKKYGLPAAGLAVGGGLIYKAFDMANKDDSAKYHKAGQDMGRALGKNASAQVDRGFKQLNKGLENWSAATKKKFDAMTPSQKQAWLNRLKNKAEGK